MARDAFVIGPMTTGFFAIVPVGEFFLWLWLVIAAEIAVVVLLHREYRTRASPALVAMQDEDVTRLLRRIVPHLRSRRPQSVIEAQQRWREAAEARRRGQTDWRRWRKAS
jgi:hypothetical protein